MARKKLNGFQIPANYIVESLDWPQPTHAPKKEPCQIFRDLHHQDKETATITKAADDAAARAAAGDTETPSSPGSWDAVGSSIGGGADLDAYIQKLYSSPAPGQAEVKGAGDADGGGKGEF